MVLQVWLRLATVMLGVATAAAGASAQALPGGANAAKLQQSIDAVSETLIRATVGVRSTTVPGSGSGVIVSAEGLVLTAGHCVREAGGPMEVVLADGRVVRAKSLGAEWDVDIAMVQLDEPGPWPFAAPSQAARPAVGDWCLALGHPAGVQFDRKPVLRLGRITERARILPLFKGEQLATDCRVMPGDSGGPLFDLGGRLIGIHCLASAPNGTPGGPRGGGHATMQSFRDQWEFLLAGRTVGVNKAPRSDAKADGAAKGEAWMKQPPEPADAPVTLERLKEKWKLPDATIAQIESIKKAIPAEKFADVLRQIDAQFAAADARPTTLNLKLGTGKPKSEAVKPLPSGIDLLSVEVKAKIEAVAASSVVEVLCGGKRAAYGTVVANNLVVTKASELAGSITVRFDGKIHEATVTTTNDDNDLALLTVPLAGAKPVEWATEEPAVGRLLVAPRPGGTTAFGIVGHAARRVPTLETALREGLIGRRDLEESKRRAERLAVLDRLFAADPSRRREGFARVFSHDVNLAADESGGPLFDASGRVVGLNSAREGVAGNFAVPARIVANLTIAARDPK